MTVALVLGCNGQTGSYLCEHLLGQGRSVHGMVRHSSSPKQLWRIEPILDRLTIHEGDLTDYSSLDRIVRAVQPDEIFNLADQDSVAYSTLCPLYSVQVTYGGVANLLEVVRHGCKSARVFQPISATVFRPDTIKDMLGVITAWRCNEESRTDPQSPYAVAKMAAWHLCRHYRRRYGMHITCAIPFNHDSVRRNAGYLLGKLARDARLVAAGKLDAVTVGSLELRVDVGFAGEFAAGYIKLLELLKPDDFVLGTGSGIAIDRLVTMALCCAQVPDPEMDAMRQVDPSLGSNRLVELVADCAKAEAAVGWKPKHNALSVLKMIMAGKEIR